MSDPVKSVEIEDVLSSIRRLLADGEQQATAPGPRPVDREGQAPARPRAERRTSAPLVLTPALRVAGRAEPPAKAPARMPTPFPAPARRGVETADVPDEDFEAPELPEGALRTRL